MKIGCCISLKNIEKAKKFGYDFVELSATEIMNIDASDWNHVKQEILDSNIPIIGFNAFCNEQTPIIGPNANKSLWGAYLDEVIERASQLGCKNIGIGAPKARMIPHDYDYALATKEMETFLATAAKKAEKHNITILYEALNPKECNFGNHTKEIHDTVNRLNISNLKMVYDVYHSINSDEKYDNIKYFFNHVKHVHINSWDKNLNRFYILPKDKPYLNELFSFLQKVHYDKTISIEANDNNFTEIGLLSLNTVKEAMLNEKVIK